MAFIELQKEGKVKNSALETVLITKTAIIKSAFIINPEFVFFKYISMYRAGSIKI